MFVCDTFFRETYARLSNQNAVTFARAKFRTQITSRLLMHAENVIYIYQVLVSLFFSALVLWYTRCFYFLFGIIKNKSNLDISPATVQFGDAKELYHVLRSYEIVLILKWHFCHIAKTVFDFDWTSTKERYVTWNEIILDIWIFGRTCKEKIYWRA